MPKIERVNIGGDYESYSSKNFSDNFEKELSVKPNDTIIGDLNAPVTIISYDSFSCSHCSFFYSNTFSVIKQNYIDTKIAKFIHRDFSTDKASIDVSRLNSCFKEFVAKNDTTRQFSLIMTLYSFQNNWLKTDYLERVKKYFKIAGMSDEQIQSCLVIDEAAKKNYIEDGVNETRRIASILGISGTPSIFINNVKNDDKNSPEVLSRLIEDAHSNYKLSLESNVNLDVGTGDSDSQQNINEQESA